MRVPWTGLAVIAACMIAWEMWALLRQDLAGYFPPASQVLLPSASAILRTFFEVIASGEILEHLGVSLWRAGLGYALAALFAVTLGVAMGYWRRAYDACEITIEYLRALPPPAIIPLAMVILGIGAALKVFIIFFLCTFPVLVNTIDGVRGVDPVLIRTARTFGLTPCQTAWKVILPAAAPFIMTELRIATAIALILTVISEMIGATSGIGYFILESQRTLHVTRMYAGILVLALTGYAISRVFLLIDERILAWHKGLTRQML